MENDILKNRMRVQNNILKSFSTSNTEMLEKAQEDELEKARQIGDIHPNGKWVWGESASGKKDWKAIKGGNKPATSTAAPTPSKAQTPTTKPTGDSKTKGKSLMSQIDDAKLELYEAKAIWKDTAEKVDKLTYGDDGFEEGMKELSDIEVKYEKARKNYQKLVKKQMDNVEGQLDSNPESNLVYKDDGKIDVYESLRERFPKLKKLKFAKDFTKDKIKEIGVDYDEAKAFVGELYKENMEISKKIKQDAEEKETSRAKKLSDEENAQLNLF